MLPIGTRENCEQVRGRDRVQGGDGLGEVKEQKCFSGDCEGCQKSHLGT